MRRVSVTDLAEKDLLDIWSYISAKANPAAAESMLDRIEKRFPFLARNPYAGREQDEISLGIRSFPVGPYLIFYESSPEEIRVARILHGARDIRKAFREDSGAATQA